MGFPNVVERTTQLTVVLGVVGFHISCCHLCDLTEPVTTPRKVEEHGENKVKKKVEEHGENKAKKMEERGENKVKKLDERSENKVKKKEADKKVMSKI
jgi:hypothetical protein